ncbi:hypothetical protein DIPPA_70066 [Diplonema papillatum]|nr:hypothetical protein DIPPA_70066 [Diplonema papillatum]
MVHKAWVTRRRASGNTARSYANPAAVNRTTVARRAKLRTRSTRPNRAPSLRKLKQGAYAFDICAVIRGLRHLLCRPDTKVSR